MGTLNHQMSKSGSDFFIVDNSDSDWKVHRYLKERGKGDRTKALKTAITQAEKNFELHFGFGRSADWQLTVNSPVAEKGLQAVDYYLWALQRFYELQEERYIHMLWPQIGEEHDLHHGGGSGTFFKGADLPTLDTAFPRRHEGKKKATDIGA